MAVIMAVTGLVNKQAVVEVVVVDRVVVGKGVVVILVDIQVGRGAVKLVEKEFER